MTVETLATDATSLTVQALTSGYGSGTVLHDVSLAAAAGQLTVVVGRNGAGKSTLLKTVSGLVRPRSGRILMGTTDLTRLAAFRRARLGLVQVPEGRRLFRQQSVAANLELGGYPVPRARRSRGLPEQVLEYFPILRQRLHHPAGALSGGQQQMLAIAQALLSQPRVLLLDEPSLGLAGALVDEVFAVLAQLRASGTTIVLVEQFVERALGIADQVVVLRNGRVTASGEPSDQQLRQAVQEAYLAGGPAGATSGGPA